MNDVNKAQILTVVKLWDAHKPQDLHAPNATHFVGNDAQRIMHYVVRDIASGDTGVDALRRALQAAIDLYDDYEARHWLELYAGELGYSNINDFARLSDKRKETLDMYSEFIRSIRAMIDALQRDADADDPKPELPF